MTIMELSDVSFAYPGGMDVLQDVNLKVEAGEFLLLCGPSGCGKTTLLRCMKKQIAPAGVRSGKITDHPAAEIGFVFQNPENQIVTDTVRHELAFGLENMGLPTDTIRRRVAETALFFGITEWIDKQVHEISGGQKQLLNLAAVIAMRPKLLLLDEPVSQIDPSARKNFLELLMRVNRELGIAVILSEHHLEEVMSLADRILYMKDGKFEYEGDRDGYAQYILTKQPAYGRTLPAAARMAHSIAGEKEQYPLTVRAGRDYVQEYIREQKSGKKYIIDWLESENYRVQNGQGGIDRLLYIDHIWFQYEKQTPYVLKGLELTINTGECHMILGGNGSGKTTLLAVLGKRLCAGRGKIRVDKAKGIPTIGLLVQNPKAMFTRDTVEEELDAAETPAKLRTDLGLNKLFKQHPYDISGGEQQRLALALVLTRKPDLLLLDEPVKGLDISMREELGLFLRNYAAQGHAVVCVTHDVEFADRFGDVCSLLFEGEILSTEPADIFFKDNAFYTTDAQRIIRGIAEGE